VVVDDILGVVFETFDENSNQSLQVKLDEKEQQIKLLQEKLTQVLKTTATTTTTTTNYKKKMVEHSG